MESLGSILGSRKLTPPDDMTAIKDYVEQKYKSKCQVKLQRGALLVSLPNSALTATLQLERQHIIEACKITKKLVFRTGI